MVTKHPVLLSSSRETQYCSGEECLFPCECLDAVSYWSTRYLPLCSGVSFSGAATAILSVRLRSAVAEHFWCFSSAGRRIWSRGKVGDMPVVFWEFLSLKLQSPLFLPRCPS